MLQTLKNNLKLNPNLKHYGIQLKIMKFAIGRVFIKRKYWRFVITSYLLNTFLT